MKNTYFYMKLLEQQQQQQQMKQHSYTFTVSELNYYNEHGFVFIINI